MGHLSVILILCVAGCVSGFTTPIDDLAPAAYSLASVNRDSLPAVADRASVPRWVRSGSLVLQPDGYYVLSESDSIWNGRSLASVDRTEGGIWTADASVLALTDTATR